MEVNKVYCGDAEGTLKLFLDNFFDSYVSDPPYGLKFMGKHWDYDVPKVPVFKEMYRTLKPGGHILIACGTRTQHRMAVNIEDAGFEIRDVISWLYGSGFPKSLNVALAIDKQSGVIGDRGKAFRTAGAGDRKDIQGKNGEEGMTYNEPITEDAKQWQGWGTALKPSQEFWTLARKPLSEKTVAENVLKWGTGGINIDGCRIGTDENIGRDNNARINGTSYIIQKEDLYIYNSRGLGRFPSNVILDEFMGKELDKQTGILTSGKATLGTGNIDSQKNGMYGSGSNGIITSCFADSGGASRFFYCAKADNFQRNKGLKDFDKGEPPASARSKAAEGRENALGNPRANHHPTVKPIDLMRYLVKLITPKNGLTCDPFCGSGTTLIGAKLELINYIGIEREKEYCEIAEARVAAWNPDKYKEQSLF